MKRLDSEFTYMYNCFEVTFYQTFVSVFNCFFFIQVLPRPVEEADLLNNLSSSIGADSELGRILESGEQLQKAASLIYSMVSEINVPSSYVSDPLTCTTP